MAGLEAYRRPLASLRTEDFVTVAVDLVPDVLLPRVRRGTLLDARPRRRSPGSGVPGRLSAADFRKRVEFEEN